MTIFETERLIIQSLKMTDENVFFELLSDPKVIDPIPQQRLTESQISDRFHKNLNLKLGNLKNERSVCGIFEKGNPDMIGLCLFLLNDENDHELGYRFGVNYWGKGYATETTRGMIEYYFNQLQVDKVTADVNIENISSIKILSKFMTPVREFFNERDHCTDRRYEAFKSNWQQNGI